MSASLLQFDDAVTRIALNNEENGYFFRMSADIEDDELEETKEEMEIIEAALHDPYEEDSDSINFEDGDEHTSDSDSDSNRAEKILDVLIPPAEFRLDGVEHIQRVSRVAPSRTAVIQLWEQLDLKLKEKQARANGICAIRRNLYQEAFDELIRQVTLDCPERGLLLARVRDEAAMTIAAFQSLFHSASQFGATKAIQAESGKSELEEDLRSLEDRVCSLEAENRRLDAWRKQVGRRARERREVQMSLFTEEFECLQRSEQQYQVSFQIKVFA